VPGSDAPSAGPRDLPSAGPGGPAWRWPPGGTGGGWALPEEEFEQTDAVMTKAEVRAVALARLAPGPGRLIWDVGAGTGSVGIECARLGAAVIAIERDSHRAKLVRENARRHGADVRVVEGQAPGVLDGLPAMDAAYIGGGGPGVVASVASRSPAIIVVALAAVDRVGPACTVLGAAGYTVNGTLLQASRMSPLPGGAHRFEAVNPVFLLWGTRSQGQPEGQMKGQPDGRQPGDRRGEPGQLGQRSRRSQHGQPGQSEGAS
jgi:precorrin-6Y C5,15-methyltransferase (decarboxylating)